MLFAKKIVLKSALSPEEILEVLSFDIGPQQFPPSKYFSYEGTLSGNQFKIQKSSQFNFRNFGLTIPWIYGQISQDDKKNTIITLEITNYSALWVLYLPFASLLWLFVFFIKQDYILSSILPPVWLIFIYFHFKWHADEIQHDLMDRLSAPEKILS